MTEATPGHYKINHELLYKLYSFLREGHHGVQYVLNSLALSGLHKVEHKLYKLYHTCTYTYRFKYGKSDQSHVCHSISQANKQLAIKAWSPPLCPVIHGGRRMKQPAVAADLHRQLCTAWCYSRATLKHSVRVR